MWTSGPFTLKTVYVFLSSFTEYAILNHQFALTNLTSANIFKVGGLEHVGVLQCRKYTWWKKFRFILATLKDTLFGLWSNPPLKK